MNRFLTLCAAFALGSATVVMPVASAAPSATGIAHRAARTCAAPAAGDAACDAVVVADENGRPITSAKFAATPAGYGPADLQSAYKTPSTTQGAGKTVAIVDAYNDPTAASDLTVYRAQFGLPTLNTGGPTFKKVNQSGGTSYPRNNAGWATEISLDLDMVSAVCPNCNILLVEASSASFTNLGAAVNYAAKVAGVVAISNSYGGSDSSPLSAYNHPGIAITASTGDSGYGVQSPASFDTVVAVGGTHLTGSVSTGWSETAWSGAGSGCSTKNAKPSWQTAATQCAGKANADVSADADPYTGVAVYDSTSYNGSSGWQVYGGTSVASPIIASVYALSGNTGGYPASIAWSASTGLNDVTSGSNGTCSTSVWCTSGPGWDGPTGLGTPNGVTAF